MNNLFNPDDVSGILERIEKLSPDSQRQWGKMNVAQMLAHCHKSMETAMGDNTIPRLFIGRILGPFVRNSAISAKPFPKNSPTDKSYVFTNEKDFVSEKTNTMNSIRRFFDGGAEGCTKVPHPFFGKFTPDEWAVFQWKHLDHHLRQFGV